MRILLARARLDNRKSLIRELDAGTADVTDTDLLLAAYDRWGDDVPSRLEGDFAFALRDLRNGRVFAARDRLGTKPLLYRVSDRGIEFASDLLSLAPDELDETRVADALVPVLEGADATRTFFRGVRRLPPGHRLTFEAGRVRVSAYWSPDPSREFRCRRDADYVRAFREVFSEAVRCCLTEDAGSMLSGGLDSSALVAFGRKLRIDAGGAPLCTFSAIRDDPDCEESRHVRAVAALAGQRSIAVRPRDLPDFDSEIDGFFLGPAEPFDSAMIVPLLMAAAARRHGLRALLDGVDGDVVASAEPDFLESLLVSGAWGTAIAEARGLARFYQGSYRPWSSPGRLLLGAAARSFAPGPLRRAWRGLRHRSRVRDVLSGSPIRRDFAARVGLEDRLREVWARPPAAGPRERQVASLVHPRIVAALERYHRVAAWQGIEARHPFLDRRVVEFCLALPWDRKVRDGWSKVLVREACEGLLPDEVRWRRGRWVRLGPSFLGAFLRRKDRMLWRGIEETREALEPFVDLRVLRRVYEGYRSAGDAAAGETVWHVLHLGRWLQRSRTTRYDPGRVTAAERVVVDAFSAEREGEFVQETVRTPEDGDVRPPPGTHHGGFGQRK